MPSMSITFSVITTFVFLQVTNALAQIPTGTPRTDEPFLIQTTADIIIYIVLPILILILFIFWWKFYKKPKDEEEKEKKKGSSDD